MMTDYDRIRKIFELAKVFDVEDKVEITSPMSHNLLEVDENGAWVKAWIWVDFAGTALDKGPQHDDR